MEFIQKHKNEIVIVIAALFVFLVFAFITRLTPLAGDDWGYAVGGRTHNPFLYAYEFYFSWSGRYFSELWGFIVAPRKWLWNVLNPLLFTGIFVSIMTLIRPKKNVLMQCLIVIGLMFSVEEVLRIETYTWIMGTTYVIPLFLLLVYLNIVKPVLFSDKTMPFWKVIVCCGINFYIGLCMENAAGILILCNICILIYSYFKKRELLKKFILITIFSIVSFTLLRMSPGANYRLYRDNDAWLQMNLFEQIGSNWLNFIRYTFTENTFLLMGLSAALMVACVILSKKEGKVKTIYIVLFVMNFICFIAALSPKLYNATQWNIFLLFYDFEFSRSAIYFVSVFYPIYVIVVFVELFLLYRKESLYEAILYILLAGGANIVMLISPIFGARSSLYTVYFLIVLTAYVLNTIEIDQKVMVTFCVIFACVIAMKVKEFNYKYKEIARVQDIRDGQIEYYRVNQDEEEAWIIRMPKGYIHSADIEEGDDYHMDTFKEYYGLNPNVHLVFYKE